MLALVWPKLKLDINTEMSEKNIQRMTGDRAEQESAVRVPGPKHQTGNQTLMHKTKSEMSFLRKRLGDDLQTRGFSLIKVLGLNIGGDSTLECSFVWNPSIESSDSANLCCCGNAVNLIGLPGVFS